MYLCYSRVVGDRVIFLGDRIVVLEFVWFGLVIEVVFDDDVVEWARALID